MRPSIRRTDDKEYPEMASKYASKEFWTQTADRAISTFAQTAVGSFVVGTTGLLTLDFITIGSLAGAAALASVLQSVAFRGAPEKDA
jgi:hypothetical protein